MVQWVDFPQGFGLFRYENENKRKIMKRQVQFPVAAVSSDVQAITWSAETERGAVWPFPSWPHSPPGSLSSTLLQCHSLASLCFLPFCPWDRREGNREAPSYTGSLYEPLNLIASVGKTSCLCFPSSRFCDPLRSDKKRKDCRGSDTSNFVRKRRRAVMAAIGQISHHCRQLKCCLLVSCCKHQMMA